jgi:hypothetical protein
MKKCHKASSMSIPGSAWRKLAAFLDEWRERNRPEESFSKFEERLHDMVCELECEILAGELERYDIDVPVIEVDGERYKRVYRTEQKYLSGAGEVRVDRTVYRNSAGDRDTKCPMELRAGIVEGYWTVRAAELGAWSVAHMTPGESEQLFSRFGGMRPSRSSLDRLPKTLSERWESKREHFEKMLRSEEEIPGEAVTLAVSLDGVKTPMRDGERKQKREAAREAGKQTKGPAGYREVCCGTVSLYDREGDRLVTWRMARMPEKDSETLKRMLIEEVDSILSARPDLRLIKLADGARGNWTFLTEKLPDGDECVDFFHAAEHLNLALAEAYGESSPKCKSQFQKLRLVLRDEMDGVEKVIRALIYLTNKYPRRKKIKTELGYFRRNRHRMRYAELRARNLPIGSGVVEAACKTLVTQRLKRSGMRWRDEGGQAILTLRAFCQSDRFDRAWRLIAETYRSVVSLPEKVIPLRPKRAA